MNALLRLAPTLIGLNLLLAACSTPAPFQMPTVEVPATFKEAALWKLATPSQVTVPDAWWTLFNDPALNDLQAQMVLGNQNLKASAALVQVAQAALGSSRAGLSPTVGINAAASRNASPSAVNNTNISNSNSLGASASWELDVWGRISSGVTSADARLQASQADLDSARLSIHALLAQTYFSLRSAEAQSAILERTVTAYQRSLVLTENRYTAGIASAADVAQATTQLRATQAQLIDSNSTRAQSEHAIATLLGQSASLFTLPRTASLPTAPQPPVQLPADLLLRRPDIAAAAARVKAASAQIGVAKAAYFPSITLSASGGFRAAELVDVLSAPSQFWSFGPSLALALLDGGARKANVDSATASTAQATAVYRQAVIAALQEVEDNLIIFASLGESLVLQTDAQKSAQRNLEITNNQYQAGTVSYLNVVTAQATALSTERTLLDTQTRRLAASAQLLKNLGGRWGTNGAIAPVAAQ
jgi:NodT family efflux transporter outer membrane factor (OMF) lipoprotein